MDNNTSLTSQSPAVDLHCLGRESSVGVEYSAPERVVLSVACVVFCLIGLLGNVAVVLVIYKDHVINKHKQNLYLLSLAVADASLVVFVVPFSLTNELLGKWPFGHLYCRIYLSIDIMLCTASIWNICFIGLDRYVSVSYPTTYKKFRTVPKIRLAILFIWFYSAALSLLSFAGKTKDSGSESCSLNDSTWFIVLSTSLSFFIPAIIVWPIYVKIYKVGKKMEKKRKIRKLSIYGDSMSISRSGRHGNDHQGHSFASGSGGIHRKSGSLLSPEVTRTHSNGTERKKSSLVNQNQSTNNLEVTNETSSCGNFLKILPKNNNLKIPKKIFKHSNKKYVVEKLPDTTLYHDEQNHGDPSHHDDHMNVENLSVAVRHNLTVSSVTCNIKSLHRESCASQGSTNMSKRERRFLFIISIVMGCFMFCWLPFFLTYAIYAVCRDCCVNVRLFTVFFWLGYLNSALNPILYTIFNKDFRRAFKRLFGIFR